MHKRHSRANDAHSREAVDCRKRPREARECAKAHSLLLLFCVSRCINEVQQKGLNTGLRADAAQGKSCVQEEIFMSRSAKNDKTKTNVMRLLDAAKIPYEAKEYPVDENDLSGSHAADMLGVDHGSVFKTLVLKGERTGFLVCCIPVDGEVDLKKAAKAAGDKKVEMLPMKDLLATTGYIRGGCSPIGMKKRFPTFIDEAALKYETIAVSAGQRGFQVLLSPQALADYVGAKLLDLQQNG